MNIVVTGGAGAVGSYLCLRLLQDGHKVLCLDNFLTGSKDNIMDMLDDPNFYFRKVDVSNERDIRDYIADADIVYHLAGSVGVMLVDREPLRCLDNNLRTGQAVFKVAREHGVRVVYTSSSEVYGNGWGKPFQETDPLIIGSPDKMRWAYASSKLTQEFLLKGMTDNFVIARLFNIVSDRHKKSYVIPSFTDKANKGETLEIHGDGSAIRYFCHVQDAVEYLVRLGLNESIRGEIVNIGNPDNGITINDLACSVIKQLDSNSEIKNVQYNKVFSGQHDDIDYRQPDTTKVKELTKYKPKYDLKSIIEMFDERENTVYSSAS